MRHPDAVVAAARACLGAPFRLHGRDPAFGLDCVGLAAGAFGIDVPARYPSRGGRAATIAAAAGAAGLRATAPSATRPGDLLLVAGGPEQLHLAVLTPAGFIHADAGLGRVVEVPGPPAGAVLGAWRGEG